MLTQTSDKRGVDIAATTANALGAVACGHPVTAAAASEVLRDGGNAYDAVIAAQLAACVVEPVFASLAGGGYSLVHPAGEAPEVYDFFTQTPRRAARPGSDDFHPVHADFGTATQEFHIGLGAAAVPGMVAGVFQLHRDHATLPMARLAAPAIHAARTGISFSAFHSYLFDVVAPIYTHSAGARAVYAPDGTLPAVGARLCQDELAATIDALVREGPQLFYRGAIAQRIVELCRDGGALTAADLAGYRVGRAASLSIRYRDATLHTNPPPSSGGTLIAFGLQLMERETLARDDDVRRVELLSAVMALTQRARLALGEASLDALLDPALLDRYRADVADRPACLRGTTHISVVDAAGNLAATTLSNGEGCGHVIPGTGIMLNNMLGEEDINPEGFQRWRPDTRMTSMMAPSLLEVDDGARIVMGSGGSNRIRTAMLQVVSNLVDLQLTLAEAVERPRLHVDGATLSLEPGLPAPTEPGGLTVERWDAPNLFFGGVHCAAHDRDGFAAAGDPRREGYGAVVVPAAPSVDRSA